MSSSAIISGFLSASQNGQVLLLYYGRMDRDVKENLLKALRFNLTDKAVPVRFRKRAFFIADECITNIYQYYCSSQLPASLSGISVYRKGDLLEFVFTNTVMKSDKEKLEEHLKKICHRPPEKVKEAFEEGITSQGPDEEGKAGLGLIIVSQRALGNFDHHFEGLDDGNFLFHLKISLDLK